MLTVHIRDLGTRGLHTGGTHRGQPDVLQAMAGFHILATVNTAAVSTEVRVPF